MAQRVAGSEVRRYSGAPLPMSFGEAGQRKIVLALKVTESGVLVDELAVPCFQPLATLRGNWTRISERLAELKEDSASAWLEVMYDGEEIIADLQERLRELIEGTALEILRTKNLRLAERVLSGMSAEETLDDLSVEDVFARCLAAHAVPAEQRDELVAVFQEAVLALHGQDPRGSR